MRTLRATTSTGAVVDDPTPVQVWALVDEVSHAGNGAFLIVERGLQSFVQAMARGGTFVVEILDGSRVRHSSADGVSARAVAAVIASWTAGTRDWQAALPWQRVA